MTTEELQSAFDTLTAGHAALTAAHAELSKRYEALLAAQTELKGQLAATEMQRDTFKQGFETQTANHERCQGVIRRLRAGETPAEMPPATPAA